MISLFYLVNVEGEEEDIDGLLEFRGTFRCPKKNEDDNLENKFQFKIKMQSLGTSFESNIKLPESSLGDKLNIYKSSELKDMNGKNTILI